MAALPFIDTNIFLRHLLGDHPEHSPKATALFGRIERGELRAQTSEMVIFETVFTLERSYSVPKAAIRESVLALLALSGLLLRGKRRYQRIFELYVDSNLPFGDAYIVAQMEQLQADQIYTFDRELDRKAPGITRLEP